jgi:hypothetical protein
MTLAYRFAFVLYAVVALGLVVVLTDYDFSAEAILGAAVGYVFVGGAALIYWRWSQYPRA